MSKIRPTNDALIEAAKIFALAYSGAKDTAAFFKMLEKQYDHKIPVKATLQGIADDPEQIR